MLVQILFSLQTVSPNRHAVIGRVEDVCVVQFSHRFKSLQHAPNLDVDVLAAGELASQFIADRPLVTILPDATDVDFIPHGHVRVVEWMSRQVVDRQRRLFWICRRQGVLVGVIHRTVFHQ